MMSFVPGAIVLSYVGTILGTNALAAASIGLFALNLVLYPLYGLSFAVDTLVSQEHGRDPQSTQQGVILQRGLVVNCLALIPATAVLWFRHALLASFFPKKTAENTAEFLTFGIIFVMTMTLTTTIGKFLSNQGLPHLVTASTATVLVTCPLSCRHLIPLFGLHGAMLAMGLTGFVCLVLITLLTVCTKQSRESFGSWEWGEVLGNKEAFKEHMWLALPSMLFVTLEASSFDMTVLIASAHGDENGAAWSCVLNVLMIFVAITGGMVVASTACVGSAIGRGKPQTAYRYAVLAVIMTLCIALIDDCIISNFFNLFLSFFTSDKEVIVRAETLKWVALCIHFVDSGQFVFQGIMSGAGRNDQGAKILLVALWLIGIPCSLLFPRLGMFDGFPKVYPVVCGLLVGLCVELPALLVAFVQWDWNELVEEARDDND